MGTKEQTAAMAGRRRGWAFLRAELLAELGWAREGSSPDDKYAYTTGELELEVRDRDARRAS